jgi:2-polyprenyl-6-methoxyphenol hydroxylase-like FAD-dependent oxidoreductase
MIAIIGAGMAGLTLASVLHRHDVPFAIYDGDASATSRHQGGMLDIHEDTGQIALAAAGLSEAFRNIIFEGGDAMRIVDKTGTIRMEDDGDGSRPEVDRGALRDLLLSSLPEGTVRWGSRVTDAYPDGSGYRVSFADGTSIVTDMLVGADGAWSKVRPIISNAVPEYLGHSFVEVRIPDAAASRPELAVIVGHGSLFALSHEKGILAHHEGNGEICVYVAIKAPIEQITGQPVTEKSLLDHFSDWHEDLRGLISAGDGAFLPRPLYALPSDHRWDHRPGVTLIGDAAHLMSPFAGEGANLAMFDGAMLASAIVDNPHSIDAAVAAFEAEMFERSRTSATESAGNLIVSFQPDAPQGLIDRMVSYGMPERPRLLTIDDG